MFRVVLCIACTLLSFNGVYAQSSRPASSNSPKQAVTQPHSNRIQSPLKRSAARSQEPTASKLLPAPGIKHKKPHFRTFATFQDAVREARRLKRPIFLDLYAVWCVPCKRLEEKTFSHPLVHTLLSKYLVIRFDIDQMEGKRLTRRFRVRRFPTTLILDSNGNEVERIIGYYTARYFRPAIVAGYLQRNTYQQLRSGVQAQPNNLLLRLRLADRLILRRQVEPARMLYQSIWKTDRNNKKKVGAWALFGLARSYTRMGMYAYALPWLDYFHKQYPGSTNAQLEAYRLHLYALEKTREHKKYKQMLLTFKKKFTGKSPVFK